MIGKAEYRLAVPDTCSHSCQVKTQNFTAKQSCSKCPKRLKWFYSLVFILFVCFKSSLQLLQAFSRTLQLWFTVKLQNCFADYENFTCLYISVALREDAWVYIVGWTAPLKTFFISCYRCCSSSVCTRKLSSCKERVLWSCRPEKRAWVGHLSVWVTPVCWKKCAASRNDTNPSLPVTAACSAAVRAPCCLCAANQSFTLWLKGFVPHFCVSDKVTYQALFRPA